MNEPVWILPQEVRLIHQMQLAEHGGATGVRDQSMLESALGKPKNLYADPPASIFQLAASYSYGLAKNHAFVDGNKRTALVICLSFLQQNGIVLIAEPEDRYLIFYRLAAGDLSEAELAIWLHDSCRPV